MLKLHDSCWRRSPKTMLESFRVLLLETRQNVFYLFNQKGKFQTKYGPLEQPGDSALRKGSTLSVKFFMRCSSQYMDQLFKSPYRRRKGSIPCSTGPTIWRSVQLTSWIKEPKLDFVTHFYYMKTLQQTKRLFRPSFWNSTKSLYIRMHLTRLTLYHVFHFFFHNWKLFFRLEICWSKVTWVSNLPIAKGCTSSIKMHSKRD